MSEDEYWFERLPTFPIWPQVGIQPDDLDQELARLLWELAGNQVMSRVPWSLLAVAVESRGFLVPWLSRDPRSDRIAAIRIRLQDLVSWGVIRVLEGDD